jgi:hypothetical protein
MRYLAVILLALVAPAAAPPRTTVYFKFEGLSSPAVYDSMKREMNALFLKTALTFEWKRLEEAAEFEAVPNLVVVRFRGDCRMTHPYPPFDEQGLLAWTEVTDVLPFSTVDCDRVRNAVSTAMWGADRPRGEQLMGRALARIVAHELFHLFTKSGAHSERGVARQALTGAELIANDTSFHPEDFHRLPGGVSGK